MSERYTRLFLTPKRLYSEGSPVLIAAGALLRDNKTESVLAQLKFRSICDKQVNAITVRIHPFDAAGEALGEAVTFQYRDLDEKRDVPFGSKIPIPLPNAATRAYAPTITEVTFSDNSVWTASDAPWEPLSKPRRLETALEDEELVTQYRLTYGKASKCLFGREKALWRCPCGALNRADEGKCHLCGQDADALGAMDIDALKAERDRRLAAERKKAEEDAAEKAALEAKAAARKRSRMKRALPAALVAFAAIVAVIALPKLFAGSGGNTNESTAAATPGKSGIAALFTQAGTAEGTQEQSGGGIVSPDVTEVTPVWTEDNEFSWLIPSGTQYTYVGIQMERASQGDDMVAYRYAPPETAKDKFAERFERILVDGTDQYRFRILLMDGDRAAVETFFEASIGRDTGWSQWSDWNEITVHKHAWSEGTVVSAATGTAAGTMRFTCTTCGEVKDVDIAPIGLIAQWNGSELSWTLPEGTPAPKYIGLYLNRTGSGSNQYRTTKASQKEAAAAFSETLAQFLDQGAKGNEIRFRVCLLDEADSLDGVEECTWSEWSDYRQF